MKKILFDLWKAQPNENSKFHGGGEYIKSVYLELINRCDCNIIVFYDTTKFLDDWIIETFKRNYIKSIDVKGLDDVQKILNEVNPDVFYSGLPYTYGSLKIPQKTHFCGTIHGLRSLELTFDLFEYKYYGFVDSCKIFIKSFFRIFYRKHLTKLYGKSLENLDSVFCVSNHTKYAIKNFFPNLHKRIECFYTPEKLPVNCRCKIGNLGKYILLISCNRFEKNSYRAIAAIESLFNKGLLGDYKVATVGELPTAIKKKINHIERYIQFDYLSPEQLDGLYADCDFFLYPTLNEGFGMPPLEAMKYGKTCIVSGVCSVPEVCGNAVYYINPYDINEIQTRILYAAENKIPIEVVADRFRFINGKQKSDLKKLCDYIFNVPNSK